MAKPCNAGNHRRAAMPSGNASRTATMEEDDDDDDDDDASVLFTPTAWMHVRPGPCDAGKRHREGQGQRHTRRRHTGGRRQRSANATVRACRRRGQGRSGGAGRGRGGRGSSGTNEQADWRKAGQIAPTTHRAELGGAAGALRRGRRVFHREAQLAADSRGARRGERSPRGCARARVHKQTHAHTHTRARRRA